MNPVAIYHFRLKVFSFGGAIKMLKKMHILNKSIFDITGILSIRPIRKLTF